MEVQQQDAKRCRVCDKSLNAVFGGTCGRCGRKHHADCGVAVSVEPEGVAVKSAGRVSMCKCCAWAVVASRVKSGAFVETAGHGLSLRMRVVLKGVEHFFLFLGLAEANGPEDYRRDREQAVFALYKMMPALLVGGPFLRNGCKVSNMAPAGMMPLSVFVPLQPPTLDPEGCVTVVVAFHGGAFVMGSFDSPAIVTMLGDLVRETKVIAVSANYRKAPENHFPAWNNDASHAIAFVADQLPYTDVFPTCAGIKIVVLGDSAGGNIACSTAHAHRSHVAHGLYLYPILNLFSFDTDSWVRLGAPEKHLLLTRSLAQSQCVNLFKERDHAMLPLASPVFETQWEDVPECHLMVGAYDPLLDDSKHYYSLCKAHDVPCSMTVYSTAPHGWISFPQSSAEKEEGVQEMNAVVSHWATQCVSKKSKRLI